MHMPARSSRRKKEPPPRYDFAVPEAQWLADLYGIAHDLAKAQQLCARYLEEAARIKRRLRGRSRNQEAAERFVSDLFLHAELAFAAVIRYGRTFGSGVRRGVPARWISALPAELRQAHREFKKWRDDTYIAHSVSSVESVEVAIYTKLDDAGNEVADGLRVMVGHPVMLNEEEFEGLMALTDALSESVAAEVKVEEERVLDLAKAMPIEQLRSRRVPPEPSSDTSRSAWFRPRRRF
jgi:hypothetical protein